MSNVDVKFIEKLWNESEGESEDFLEIESGDWEIEFKDYASKVSVIQYKPTSQYFRVTESRSGSYYSDYDYDAPDFVEVTPVQVMRTEYHLVAAK